MNFLRTYKSWALACTTLGLLTLPSAAVAADAPTTGGTSAPAAPTTTPTTTTAATTPLTSAPTGPDSIQSPPAGGVLLGQNASIVGELEPLDAGINVDIQVLEPLTGWTTVANTVATSGGSFSAHWRSAHIGMFSVRAVPAGAAQASSVTDQATVSLEIYRPVIATWYGPGLYGRQTACGQTLTPELVGIAHPALPCGSLVDIDYKGQKLTLPVVDHGPYGNGASFDLTAAAASELDITETVHLGALAER